MLILGRQEEQERRPTSSSHRQHDDREGQPQQQQEEEEGHCYRHHDENENKPAEQEVVSLAAAAAATAPAGIVRKEKERIREGDNNNISTNGNDSHCPPHRHRRRLCQKEDETECILKTALAFVVLRRRVNQQQQQQQQEETRLPAAIATATTTTRTTAVTPPAPIVPSTRSTPVNNTSVGGATSQTPRLPKRKSDSCSMIRQVYRMALSTAWPLYHSFCIGSSSTTSTSTTTTTTTPLSSFPIYDYHTVSLSMVQMQDKLWSSYQTSKSCKKMATATRTTTTNVPVEKKEYPSCAIQPLSSSSPSSSSSSSSSSFLLHTYAVLDGIVSHLATIMVGTKSTTATAGAAAEGAGGGSCVGLGMIFYHEILVPTLRMEKIHGDCGGDQYWRHEDKQSCLSSTHHQQEQERQQQQHCHSSRRALQNLLSMCTVLHRLVIQKGKSHPFLVDDLIRGICRVIQCLYMGHHGWGWLERTMEMQNQSATCTTGTGGKRGGSSGGCDQGKRNASCIMMDNSWRTTKGKKHNWADVVVVNMLVLLEEMISFKISLAKDEVGIGKHTGGASGGGGGGDGGEEHEQMTLDEVMLQNAKVSKMAEHILRDLNSVLGGAGGGGEGGDAAFGSGGLFLPVPTQEMAGFYLRQKKMNECHGDSRSRAKGGRNVSFSRGEGCNGEMMMEEEDDYDNDVLPRLSSGAKLMTRMYLFDLVHKLSSYHLDS